MEPAGESQNKIGKQTILTQKLRYKFSILGKNCFEKLTLWTMNSVFFSPNKNAFHLLQIAHTITSILWLLCYVFHLSITVLFGVFPLIIYKGKRGCGTPAALLLRSQERIPCRTSEKKKKNRKALLSLLHSTKAWGSGKKMKRKHFWTRQLSLSQ